MNLDIAWWQNLSPQWKSAFAEVFFNHTNEPTPQELAQLFASPVLRLAGPEASFANLSFALTDLSGVSELINLEVLVVINHHLESVQELQSLSKLKALFLNNNRIESLAGIEGLLNLEQLFLPFNRVDSIQPVQKLTGLRELYIHDNCIASLEGLTEAHSDNLKRFVCLPNEQLKQKEVMRVERELYIRCRGL